MTSHYKKKTKKNYDYQSQRIQTYNYEIKKSINKKKKKKQSTNKFR